MGHPGCDEGESKKELGDVTAGVHQVRGAPQLFGWYGNADERSGGEQLGERGMAGDGDSEDDEPCGYGRPAGSGVCAGDHPGEQVAGDAEVRVHEVV
jgi:hypothetical protein